METSPIPTPVAGGYPVVRTIVLAPPQRSLLRGRYRDPAEIPVAGPHETLVICADSTYHVKHGQFFRGTEPYIAGATSVSIVDTTVRRTVSTTIGLSSSDVAVGFDLTVGFSCTVDDPAVVVKHGLADLPQRLNHYLGSHPRVLDLGVAFSPDDLDLARESAAATLQPLRDLDPVFEPGMTIELTTWSIRATAPTIAWAEKFHHATNEQRLRDTERTMQYAAAVEAIRRNQHLDTLSDDGREVYREIVRGTESSPAEAAEAARLQHVEAEDRAYERWLRAQAVERETRQLEFDVERESARWVREDQARLMEHLTRGRYFDGLPPSVAESFLAERLKLDVSGVTHVDEGHELPGRAARDVPRGATDRTWRADGDLDAADADDLVFDQAVVDDGA